MRGSVPHRAAPPQHHSTAVAACSILQNFQENNYYMKAKHLKEEYLQDIIGKSFKINLAVKALPEDAIVSVLQQKQSYQHLSYTQGNMHTIRSRWFPLLHEQVAAATDER